MNGEYQGYKYKRGKQIGYLGLIGVVVFAVGWFLAAQFDPSWVFAKSLLSDLGVSDIGLARNLFNGACVICGVMIIAVGAGLMFAVKTWNEYFGTFILIIAGICIALIGLATMEISLIVHQYATRVGFGLGFGFVFFMMIEDWRANRAFIASTCLIAMSITTCVLVIGPFEPAEMLGTILFLAILTIQCIKLIRYSA